MSKVKTEVNSTQGKIIGNYSIQNAIGEGTFGKVHLGIHLITKEKVAIKILEKNKIKDIDSIERIRREILFLKSLKNENIIQLYEVYLFYQEIIENTTSIFLIMEYAEGGELFSYIVKKQRLSDKEASFFFCQIINTVETIHKNSIAHRDLKPENLLLSQNNFLKIIDFGLSNNYTSTNPLLKTPCGSPCYAAPEMLQGNKYYGIQVDIWSIGIILYAMINGFLPFEDDNNALLCKKILECKLDFPYPLSDIVIDILHKILTVNPEKRITLDEIKKHEFYLMGLKILKKHDMTYDKQKLFDITIEKMKELNFNKNEILDNLAEKKHNNITATFYIIFNRIKYDHHANKNKLKVNSIKYNNKPLITQNDSPKAKNQYKNEICQTEIENKNNFGENKKELFKKISNHFDTISNGKNSNLSKNNSNKIIQSEQKNIQIKSKIIIFKKQHNKSKGENDTYLNTETINRREISNTENKGILLTETIKEKRPTNFSYKNINILNIKNNINFKKNYISNEPNGVLLSPNKRAKFIDTNPPKDNIITVKNIAQKETPLNNYFDLNVFPLSVQNGSKIFTKIKINPNLQFLIKDFKKKIRSNNKSINKDKEISRNYNITHTQGDEKEIKVKQGLKITGNIRNHSTALSNQLNEFSIFLKNESSISKDKRAFDNPVYPILNTETNNNSSKKLNYFNKSNLIITNSEKETKLTSFANTNVEDKEVSPKLNSKEKQNSFKYNLIQPKLTTTMISNKKKVLLKNNELVFAINDIKNIKEKISLFCKRNFFTVNEINPYKFDCQKDSNCFCIDIEKKTNFSSLKVTHINGNKNITKELIKSFLIFLEKEN